jgi:beta-glucosidase-like glycosyl hydrolase
MTQDVQTGKVSVDRINQAVRRMLTLKFKLGLFEHPVVNAAAATTAVTAGRDVTLRTAQESITLPRNQNNLLPLSTRARLMVVGPSSDSMTNRLGSWSVSWQASLPATTSAAWVRQARSTWSHRPKRIPWMDAPRQWRRSLRELASALVADWPELGIAG